MSDEHTTESARYTRIERRIIGGREARVRLDPDQLYLEWRAGRPAYYSVHVGDHIKDAARDLSSPRIREWEVTEITPERVRGTDTRTGVEREWNRKRLETGLVHGNYATNLSSFETVAVHRVGSWADHRDTEHGRGYHGVPYVTVIAYGNNGEDYGCRYRFLREGDESHVSLRERDLDSERLAPALRTALDEAVRVALEDDGYLVHVHDDDEADTGRQPVEG